VQLCVQDGCLEFERAKWYDTLILYGLKEGETEDGLRQDPDLQLVPIIIEKVLLPKLTRKCSVHFGTCSENLTFLNSGFLSSCC
jgi:GC-rich sequence DNA-binding factor